MLTEEQVKEIVERLENIEPRRWLESREFRQSSGVVLGETGCAIGPVYEWNNAHSAPDSARSKARYQLRRDVAFLKNAPTDIRALLTEREELLAALKSIRKAVFDEGRAPGHHHAVMNRHRREWPVLWKAIDKALKASQGGKK